VRDSLEAREALETIHDACDEDNCFNQELGRFKAFAKVLKALDRLDDLEERIREEWG